jgi:hypothetical protein
MIDFLNNEIWKIINNFPDYEISSFGRVKSVKFGKEKILNPKINKYGYHEICLYKNGKRFWKRLCRLVLENFNPIENMNNLEVNHICGKNNFLKNLEWMTHSENYKHAYKNKLTKVGMKGEKHPSCKLKDCEVWLIKKILNSDYCKSGKINNEYIGKMFKVSKQTISNIKNEKRWSCVKYEN